MNLWLILALIVAVAGIAAAIYVAGRRAGLSGQQNSDLKSLSDIQRGQAQAAAKAPETKNELIDRIRKEGL